MPDQRIEIEIALRDALSGALKQISKEFDSVTRKLVEGGAGAGGSIRKLGNETDKLRESSQRTAQSLTAMGGLMRGVAGAIVGTAGVAAGIAMAATSLERFSAERVRLRAFGIDTGLAKDQILRLRYALQLNALSAQEADQKIGGFFSKVREMATLGPYSEFYKAISKTGEAGRVTANRMMEMAKSGDAWGALMEYVALYERQEEDAQRNYLSLVADLNKSILGSLRRNLADVAGITFADVSEEQVRKYLRQMTILRAGIGTAWDHIRAGVVDAVHRVGEELGKQGYTMEGFGKGVVKFLNNITPTAKTVAATVATMASIITKIAGAKRALEALFPKEGPAPGTLEYQKPEEHQKREELRRQELQVIQDTNRATKKIVDVLTEMSAPKAPEPSGTPGVEAPPASSAPSAAPPSPLTTRPQPVPQTATPETPKPVPIPQRPSPGLVPGIVFPGGGGTDATKAASQPSRPVPVQQQTPTTRPVPIPQGVNPPSPLRGKKVSMADEMEFSAQRRGGSGLQELIKRQIDNYVSTPWHPSNMIPGSGVLKFMKRDDAMGNPSRRLMRSMLGLEGDAGKEIDRSLARALSGPDLSGTVRADIDFGDMPLASEKGGMQKSDPFLPLKMEGHPQAGKASALVSYNRWTF